jgi:hypothetical protein
MRVLRQPTECGRAAGADNRACRAAYNGLRGGPTYLLLNGLDGTASDSKTGSAGSKQEFPREAAAAKRADQMSGERYELRR